MMNELRTKIVILCFMYCAAFSINLNASMVPISLDSANSSAGADWQNKTIVQVTPMELPQVIAVLTGHLANVEFKFHGTKSDKSYKLSPTHLNVSCPGTSHSVHLSAHDRFQISSLAMKQLQRSHGSLSSDLIYQLISDCYKNNQDKTNV